MNVQKKRLEKAFRAGEEVRQASEVLMDYLNKVDVLLDTRKDMLKKSDLDAIRTHSRELQKEWKMKTFEFLVATDHSAEEIKSIMSRPKKT